MTGRVIRLSSKPDTPGEHGLPKRAVARLRITTGGADGDYNRYRMEKAGGEPAQAILVITEEVLQNLQAEGWPVEPGDLGENVTLGGVREAELGPGTRLRLGDVVLELTLACDPCTETYSLPYIGKERGPAFVRTLQGRRGWYARVIQEGEVETGAGVEVLEASRPA